MPTDWRHFEITDTQGVIWLLWICPNCGAVVRDVVVHGNFHRANGERNG